MRLRLRLARRGRAARALPPRHDRVGEPTLAALRPARPVPSRRSPIGRLACRTSIPIIAVTGSSGAGTTSVTRTFEHIFRRENDHRRVHRGRRFHRYDRERDEAARWPRPSARGNRALQPLRPARRTCSPSSRRCSATTARPARGRRRKYLHDDAGGARLRAARRAPSPTGRTCPTAPTCCSTKACTAAVVTDDVDIAQHADLLIGVVPIDQSRVDPEDPPRQGHARLFHRGGDRHDPAPHARLRALHLPAVLATHINFQRVPMVDTSNPFIARYIPTPDESLVVIRFANPRASTSRTCCRCCTTRSCRARTRSWCRAGRWTSRCSSSSRR